VDSTGIYWTDFGSGTVNVIPLDGGSSTPIVAPFQAPVAIAVDSTSAYWTVYAGFSEPVGQVMKVTPK
jgi:hypothetical protein